MLITLTGPSGVGKTTLFNNLLQTLPEARPLVSTTTRAPRPSDEASFEYVSDEEFEAIKARNEFLWTVTPHGKKYGTRKKAIDEALADNTIGILVISAVEILHERSVSNIISFYIHIDDEAELRRRFEERGDMSSEEIESRIAECKSWNEEAKKTDVPFIYLDGKKKREELLGETLAHIKH